MTKDQVNKQLNEARDSGDLKQEAKVAMTAIRQGLVSTASESSRLGGIYAAGWLDQVLQREL